MQLPARNKRVALEARYNMPLREILIKVYAEKHTLQATAKELGVSQSAVSHWLLKEGLVIETRLTSYYLTPEGQRIVSEWKKQ